MTHNFLIKCDFKCTEKLKVKIKDIEKIIGQKITDQVKPLGLDTASKTGWAYFEFPLVGSEAELHVGHISSKKTGTEKFDEMIPAFEMLLLTSQPTYVIIEDTYFNRRFGNPKGYATMSRIGMIPYMICSKNHQSKRFLMASSARANIGLKPSSKKQEIVDYINHYLKLKITDHDIADAIVLALNGIYGDVKEEEQEKTIGIFGSIQKSKKKVANKSKDKSKTKHKKKVKTKRKKRVRKAS